jgi:hypothetical protein
MGFNLKRIVEKKNKVEKRILGFPIDHSDIITDSLLIVKPS